MKKYVQEGDVVTATAPADGVVSGTPLKLNGLFLIPVTTAATGEEFEANTKGVFNLPKIQADTPAQFAKAYWKADNTGVTTTASGNTLVGVFMVADAVGLTEADVRLNGVGI